MKKLKTIGYGAATLLLLFLAGNLYQLFFKPSNALMGSNMNFILLGIVLGGLLVYLILRLTNKSKTNTESISSHTIVESMRKVFKIVFAEGQFQEIYNYEDSRKLLKFIPTKKKALVIIKAKVLVGYDFEKCKWELDEESRKMKIIHFPTPEILSVETDFNYYQIEEDMFSFFNRNDLEKIQIDGKKQIEKAALQSGLKQIAAEQMRTVLTEVLTANQWQIDNPEMLTLPLQTAIAKK